YLHSTLIEYSTDGKTRKFKVTLPQNSRLKDLMTNLGIDQNNQLLLLAVNGKVADEEQILKQNDSVHFMMPISGG
nr:hypothetical protein [Phycisphaerae bacterium]